MELGKMKGVKAVRVCTMLLLLLFFQQQQQHQVCDAFSSAEFCSCYSDCYPDCRDTRGGPAFCKILCSGKCVFHSGGDCRSVCTQASICGTATASADMGGNADADADADAAVCRVARITSADATELIRLCFSNILHLHLEGW